MPNIPSPPGSSSTGVFAHAGLYTDTVTYPSGAAAASIQVTIYNKGTTTLAALFTDRTMMASAPNPVISSALGNLSFYASPAEYDVWVAGQFVFTVLVGIDPQDSSGVSSPNTAQVGADLTGTTNTTVTSTSLTAPLPIAQGGTASATKNFVDLTTGQTVAGVKTFSSPVGVPTPVNGGDAATKAYVDATPGLAVKTAARVATAAALPSNTYLSGVLTATANAALTVDGVSVSVADRVVVKNEVTQANNGIYVVTTVGDGSHAYVLTRAADANTGSALVGALILATAGTANAGTSWSVQGTGPFTLGTTAITFAQFGSSTTYSAGTGLTLTGSTFSVTPSTYDASGAAAAATASALQKSSNLSDVANAATARTNLGAGATSGLATLDSGTHIPTAQLPLTVGVIAQLSERSFSDGAITSTTTLTSATAAFTSGDTGKTVVGANIPTGTTLTFSSSTVCTLSQACTNGTSLVCTIAQAAYSLRSVYTTDATRNVTWRGCLAPTAGGGYMTAGVDDYLSTA